MQKILKDLEHLLDNVEPSTIRCFEQDIDFFIDESIKSCTQNKNFSALTNNYSIEFIKSFISNHLHSLEEILKIKNTEMVLNHIILDISTYYKIGLPFNFFKSFFDNIIKLLSTHTNCSNYNSIITLYNYLLKDFEYFISMAKSFQSNELIITKHQAIYNDYLSALLEPNLSKAVNLSKDFIQNKNDVKIFWEDIILPSMYNIGIKWSNGEISVGQEHTATTICQSVMSFHYEKILNNNLDKISVMVATSPREMHQIGAQMISDILELNNYDVHYMGSDTKLNDIISTINNENISDVIISTTILANIESTKDFIQEIKNSTNDKKITFYVGGQAFNINLNPIELVNADYYVTDTDKLLDLLKEANHVND